MADAIVSNLDRVINPKPDCYYSHRMRMQPMADTIVSGLDRVINPKPDCYYNRRFNRSRSRGSLHSRHSRHSRRGYRSRSRSYHRGMRHRSDFCNDNDRVAFLISNMVLAIGAGWALKETDFSEPRGIHLALGGLFLNGALGVASYFIYNLDLEDAHRQSYSIRDQLYVAGLNVDLYLSDGYYINTAALHLLPVAIVPILDNFADIPDSCVAIANEAGVVCNLFSLFYISHETGNDLGLYAAAVATLATFLHIALTNKMDINRDFEYCAMKSLDLHTFVLGLYALVAVEAALDADWSANFLGHLRRPWAYHRYF